VVFIFASIMAKQVCLFVCLFVCCFFQWLQHTEIFPVKHFPKFQHHTGIGKEKQIPHPEPNFIINLNTV
jgi:hypothetical protein